MARQLSGNPVGNAVIGQSGGPTAVINQSLVGLIESLRGRQEIQRIYGMKHGVSGLVNDDLLELGSLHDGILSTIAATPSAALGTTRDKPDDEYCARIFEACRKNKIHYFFYIGGNDSSDTLRIVGQMAGEQDYALRCFHIPKTIDNDLPQSDHTPGYPSAARFVIQAFMGDNLDNRALPGIKVNVVMGRHAGWLTAASLLARKFPGDGPHLIYLPEVPFDLNRFVVDVEEVYRKHGRCLIAAAEGIQTGDGTPVLQAAEEHLDHDAHGNVQLSGTGALGDLLTHTIKHHLGDSVRVRADTFGYLQRSFCGVVSEVDQQEARDCGRFAAKIAVQGDPTGSIAIRRVNDRPYEVSIERIDLSEVAAQTRTMSPELISGHCDVSDDFFMYLKPLVGKLPVIGRLY
ncbi:MAG: 6-phosphofructokinase [Planctomycetes bacterium]|nr:6-phosphofructokinase [Planctomycetota bacterium]NOG55969.1 6-phosphofructokinase [Planctomycetota bacterium]